MLTLNKISQYIRIKKCGLNKHLTKHKKSIYFKFVGFAITTKISIP